MKSRKEKVVLQYISPHLKLHFSEFLQATSRRMIILCIFTPDPSMANWVIFSETRILKPFKKLKKLQLKLKEISCQQRSSLLLIPRAKMDVKQKAVHNAEPSSDLYTSISKLQVSVDAHDTSSGRDDEPDCEA
jgi:hypothetical protein